jgi:peptidoglycan/LPS O-acetylase OafA/YrhL
LTPSDSATRPKTKIAGLDGVRGICVALVFFEHFIHAGKDVGGLGVRMFFALSGYLIVGILHSQRLAIENATTTAYKAMLSFWKNRILRIFPVYYLTLIVLFVVFLLKGHGANHQGLLYYFLFMGNFYVQNVSHSWGQFSHLWSLSVEQHFYILTSALIILIPSRYHKNTLLILIAVVLLFELYDWINWEHINQPHVPDFAGFIFMAAGGLLSLWRRSVSYNVFATLSGYLFAAAALLWLIVTLTHFTHGEGVKTSLLEGSSLAACCSVLLYLPNRPNSIVTKLLELRPLSYLGKISYGFYVYHYFFHFAAHKGALSFLSDAHSSFVLNVAQFLFTCVVAAASWELFEKRILMLKRSKPTQAVAA